MSDTKQHTIIGDKFDGDKTRDKFAGSQYNISLNSPEEIARFISENERIKQEMEQRGDEAAALIHAYHQERVLELSKPRYQVDSRFVRLTLLVDQGADAQTARFTPSQRQKYDSLTTLLAEIDEKAAVLLGRPGSGKTTLLRRLQLEQAWAQLEKQTGHIAFFVPLNRYRRDGSGPPPDPYEWLADEWKLYQPHLPDFKTLYEAGNILLLLDGLNEIPHKDKVDYRRRIVRWQTFWQQTAHYGNRIVFSCRSLDYSSSLSGESAVVHQVEIEPLTPAQIEEFLMLHLGEKSDPIWQLLQDDSQRLALFNTPFFLRLLTDQIKVSGEMPAGQAALLTGFVRRALHREVVEHKHALFEPPTLLSEEDYEQVLSNFWYTSFELPAEGTLIPALERLAYQMQAGREAEEAGLVRVRTNEAKKWLAADLAKEILAAGVQLNVLDKERGRREITFFHQLIQEYFAARIVARRPEPARLTVTWQANKVEESLADTVNGLDVSSPLPRLPATGWEESALLAAAMSDDQDAFVGGLMDAALPLAARCAAATEVTISAPLKKRVQKALISRIENSKADLRARMDAAEALGELGDPRFQQRDGVHGRYLLPPLAKIEAGRYPMGDNSNYADEKPAHTVQIAAFEIGIFPVTNGEYRLFMAADGYEDERWWQTEAARAWLRGEGSSEGQKQNVRDLVKQLAEFSEDSIRQMQVTPDQIDQWLDLKKLSPEALEKQIDEWYPADEKYRQPAYWDDGRFNHSSQPVVGITWFEARAYCAWLSAQTGDVYHLPTEAEWEAAARGKKGREYAWGKSYDAANCNTFETHIRATTPIGVFPNGRTPQGVTDLSGNVWEWTTTIWGADLQNPEFTYPYQVDDGRENEDSTNVRRVLRGGSWNNNHLDARAAYRYDAHPSYRDYDVGWRVVVRRSPSQ